jgi:uncharacterized protein
MNEDDSMRELIGYWLVKADESLDAASDEMTAGRLSFSVNRIYYACFYSVSAVLLQEGLQYKKHSGVRSVFHQHFVKTGKVSREHGRFYDELYEARQRSDYLVLARFEKSGVEEWLRQARGFVELMKKLIKNV